MGVCRVDTEKGHRQYEVRYALNDREGVASLLRDVHRLRERRYHAGDYSASDILIDLQTAINEANLTKRQRESMYYVYELDLPQKEAGIRMGGIGNDAVSHCLKGAVQRIADVYNKWNYGEITIQYTEELSLDEI